MVGLLVATSIIVRMRRRQWLKKLWLFEFELPEEFEVVTKEAHDATTALARQTEIAQELESALQGRDEETAQLYDALERIANENEQLVKEIERLRGNAPGSG
jgi:septal ring factor EnvC (AmiA/AmiB activator)